MASKQTMDAIYAELYDAAEDAEWDDADVARIFRAIYGRIPDAGEDALSLCYADPGYDAYVRGQDVRCQCGEITGTACEWSGPIVETVVVEYMPEHLRSSHVAAANRGTYPHNGGQRIRVERSCADVVTHIWVDGTQTDELDEWVSVVGPA